MFFLYITFGTLYLLYVTTKILNNKESFLLMFENDYGLDKLYSYFMVVFISCIFMWPIMMLIDLNKEQDM